MENLRARFGMLAALCAGVVSPGQYALAGIAPVASSRTAMPVDTPAAGAPMAGPDAAYETALRAYASLLGDLGTRAASDAERRLYAADRALALIRLADLAEERGASPESTRLTSDALAVCATAGLPYCSSEELRQRARSMDAFLESNKRNTRDKQTR